MTAVSVPRIEARIQTVRTLRVMVDADLAEIYGVPTKRLNEQVKRNGRRFPADFMFQLTTAEKAEVVANCDHLQKLKFSKALPFAFKRSPLLVPTTGLGAPKSSLGDALPSKEDRYTAPAPRRCPRGPCAHLMLSASTPFLRFKKAGPDAADLLKNCSSFAVILQSALQ